jgi:hypothetical protein
MPDRRTWTFRGWFLLVAASCVAAIGGGRALAVQSPPNCNGNGVNINLFRSVSDVLNGGTVDYRVTISNLSDPTINLIACDVDDLDVVLYCPGANGLPDFTMPIVLTTNLSLPADTPNTMVGAAQTCTIGVNPGVIDAAANATAGDQSGPVDDLTQGRLHDATVDHPFRSDKQLGTNVVTTTTSTSMLPTTSTTSPPQPTVCRTPGFWGTHAEADARKPRSDDVTGAFLPVTVCGVVLTNTDVGNSCSAQEALCVSPRGDQRLQLARQLTAARLNCNIAGCPSAVSTLLDGCEQACIADADATAIGKCIEDVDAFNNGTSPDAPGCHDRSIPGFDPSGPAGSPADCNRAKANDRGGDAVTIFSGDACP